MKTLALDVSAPRFPAQFRSVDPTRARRLACGCCTAGCVCATHANPAHDVLPGSCKVHFKAEEAKP